MFGVNSDRKNALPAREKTPQVVDLRASYLWQKRRKFDEMRIICGCRWIPKWNFGLPALISCGSVAPSAHAQRRCTVSAPTGSATTLRPRCDHDPTPQTAGPGGSMGTAGIFFHLKQTSATLTCILVHNKAGTHYIITRKWVTSILQLRSEHKATSGWTIIKILYWRFNKKRLFLWEKCIYQVWICLFKPHSGGKICRCAQ